MNDLKPGWKSILKQQGIFIDLQYNWISLQKGKNKCHVKGWFRHNGKVFKEQEAAKKIIFLLAKKMQAKKISEAVKELEGNFAFILETPAQILASVDKIRSYPIFYTRGDRGFYVSNSAQLLQKEVELYEKDLDSFLEFQMTGYVTGPHTLFKRLQQLQAGECIYNNSMDSKTQTLRYYLFYSKVESKKSEQELIEELDAVTTKTFKEMIETLNGSSVWVPLSGGLDSRLVLGMLLKLQYDNVTTFTYGIPKLWEVKYARKIAQSASVKWHYVPYISKEVKKALRFRERNEYFRFASGLCSVPFLTEIYAIKHLREKNFLRDNSVIINGQSGDYVTGGHIPKILEEHADAVVDFDFLTKIIIDKHFSLWLNLKTESNIAMVKERILEALRPFLCPSIRGGEAARVIEMYEWQERQSKYVVNGQRMYEWYGYDWRLPLWSDALMEFWRNVPWQLKIGQHLYKKYLAKYNPCGLFNFDPPVNTGCTPPLFRLPNYLYFLLAKVFNFDKEFFKRTFIDYYLVYSPFYPQTKYTDYLKESRYHRNYVSYYAKEIFKLIC